MQKNTFTKAELLDIFKANHKSTNEIHLRLTKRDIKDYIINGDKYFWFEILPNDPSKKPKRYIISNEQFEAILYSEQDKYKNIT